MYYNTTDGKAYFYNGTSWSAVNAASPDFTGTPTAPTASLGTSTTQIATTAFVDRVAPAHGSNAPSSPSAGRMWMNSTSKILSVYSGSAWDTVPTPGRNVLHNSRMAVCQRATSVAGISGSSNVGPSNPPTADRWRIQPPGTTIGGVWTMSVESDGPTGTGIGSSLRMLCTTAKSSLASGDGLFIRQQIEGRNLQHFLHATSAAKQWALSFWVKSTTTGTYIARLEHSGVNQVSASYAINAANTWERKTIVFPALTSGTVIPNSTTGAFAVDFWLQAGTTYNGGSLNTTWAASPGSSAATGQTNLAATLNNSWQVTGVQLEPGSACTDYEYRTYTDEYADCLRYYYRLTGSRNATLGFGFNNTTTTARVSIPFPVDMRSANNDIDTTGTAGDYQVTTANSTTTTCSALPYVVNTGGQNQYTFNSVRMAVVEFTVASGLTAGDGAMARLGSSDNKWIGFSADI